jgi:hypothetical protein
MTTDDARMAAGASDASPPALSDLLGQVAELLRALQALQQECGTYLEQLAAVDWAGLAQQGKLAGIPKFTIERTIIDARNVLNNGLQDLTDLLRVAQEPIPDQVALDDVVERVRALIRLYTDTPTDVRHRYQRLTGWLARIDQAMHQRGERPLSAQLSLPQAAPPG